MKNIKRFVSFVAVLTLLFSMTTMAFAKGNDKVKGITNNPLYYEAISQFTGIEVEELKKIEAKYGDLTELYGIYIDEDMLNRSSSLERVSLSSSGGSGDDGMSEDQYNDLLANLDDGDILVSKDQWTVVNHGHCALVDDVWSDGSVDVVEAFGPNTQSDGYELGSVNRDHWRTTYTVRVYYPSDASKDQRDDAGTYAWRNLQEKDYDAFAEYDSSKFLNCATLVWQAYDSEGIKLQKSLFVLNEYSYWYTVYPNDIVTDSDNTLKFQVNWSGDDHKW